MAVQNRRIDDNDMHVVTRLYYYHQHTLKASLRASLYLYPLVNHKSPDMEQLPLLFFSQNQNLSFSYGPKTQSHSQHCLPIFFKKIINFTSNLFKIYRVSLYCHFLTHRNSTILVDQFYLFVS